MRQRNYTDKRLFKAFQDEFEDWDVETLKQVDKTALRDLYNNLRQREVFVRRRLAGGYATVLYRMAQEKEFPPLSRINLEIVLDEYQGEVYSSANPEYIGLYSPSDQSAFPTLLTK